MGRVQWKFHAGQVFRPDLEHVPRYLDALKDLMIQFRASLSLWLVMLLSIQLRKFYNTMREICLHLEFSCLFHD